MVDVDSFRDMLFSVFDPKEGENIVLLYDVPTRECADNSKWRERRVLVDEWYQYCSVIGRKNHFSVDKLAFDATGMQNRGINESLCERLTSFNIIIAMTEFSVTSSLVPFVKDHADSMRCASMPLAERRMMDSVFSMDYGPVKKYAHALKQMLQHSVFARVVFSTHDELVLDLRFRESGADDGDCSVPGCFINLPSGEGFIAPYEGVDAEKVRCGESMSQGVMPFFFGGELVKGVVEKNCLIDFACGSSVKDAVVSFFDGYRFRRNIAELGIGCNPRAMVTGNVIEDEKAGVHIAYGTSSHIGGKVTSDIHQDIVYAHDSAVRADSLILFDEADHGVEIVKKGSLCYELL